MDELQQNNLDEFMENSPKSFQGTGTKENFLKKTKVLQKVKPHNWNKLGEKEREDKFLQIYDENLALRKKQTELEQNLKKLQTKTYLLEQESELALKGQSGEKINRETLRQLEEFRQENQALRQKIHLMEQAQKIMQAPKKREVTNNQSKVEEKAPGKTGDLLKFIDILKNRLKECEEQNKKLQQMLSDKVRIESKDTADKNVHLRQLRLGYDEMYNQFQHQQRKLEQMEKRTVELQLVVNEEREKNITLNTTIRRLEISQQSYDSAQEEIINLRGEKRRLEDRLNELSRQPIFDTFKTNADTAVTIKTLQAEVMQMKVNVENLKDKNRALESELESRKKQIDQDEENIQKMRQEITEKSAQIEAQNSKLQPFKDMADLDHDTYMKKLAGVGWKGEAPLWNNLLQITRENKDIRNLKNVEDLKKEISNLALEKGSIAAHLEKTQKMLKTQADLDAEKTRIHKAETDKLKIQLKQALQRIEELTKLQEMKGVSLGGLASTNVGQKQALVQTQQQNGVHYDDTVSVFSVEDNYDTFGEELGYVNYFDFFLGEIHLAQTDLRNALDEDIGDPNFLKSFCTVDFYDHETQNTSIAQGIVTQYQFQVSYKIVFDEFFLKYLKQSFIKIELFIIKDKDPIRVGTCKLPLVEIVKKNTQRDISAVLSGDLAVKADTTAMIANLQYKMRLRYPVADKIISLSKIYDIKSGLQQDVAEEMLGSRKRKIVVIVQRAEDLQARSSCFVYFQFLGQDYFTHNVPGSRPEWKHNSVIDVDYDESFKNFLLNSKQEFTVFDDIPPVNQDEQNDESDFVGTAEVSLAPLVTDDIVESSVKIIKNGQTCGTLHVSVFWYGETSLARPTENASLTSKTWEQEMTQRIVRVLKQKSLALYTSFRVFDQDQDGIISLQDFKNICKYTLKFQGFDEELDLYFKTFAFPVDYPSYKAKLGDYFQDQKQQGFQDEEAAYQQSRYGELEYENDMMAKYNRPQKEQEDRLQQIKDKINSVFDKELKLKNGYEQIFSMLDSNGSGSISIFEFKTFLNDHGVKINQKDLSDFFHEIDQNNDENIEIGELLQYLKVRQVELNRQKSSAQERSSEVYGTKQELNRIAQQEFRSKLQQYMKDHKITDPTRLYQMINKDGSSSISKEEIRKFFQKELRLELDLDSLNTLIRMFDTDGNNQISLVEFAENLFREDSKSQVSRKKAFDPNAVIIYLAQYLNQKGIAAHTYFNKIDVDGNGYISKKEMRDILVNDINIEVEEDVFEELFSMFDKKGEKRINLTEFYKVLSPQMESLKQQQEMRKSALKAPKDKKYLEYLEASVKEYTMKYCQSLNQMFEAKASKPDEPFIMTEDFVSCIKSYHNRFKDQELEDIIQEFCFVNQDNNINYVNFLCIGNPQFKDQNESHKKKAKQMLNECFRSIRNFIVSKQYPADKAFLSFDIDNDGKISEMDLYTSLEKMDLLGQWDHGAIQMMIGAMDSDGDNFVQKSEFLAALDLPKNYMAKK